MTDCSKVPTIDDVYSAKTAMTDISTFTYSEDDKFVDGEGTERTTISGVIKLAQKQLEELGVIFDDPIRNLTPGLLVEDVRAHRYPVNTGDIYIPTAPLPFTTGATFDPTKWSILQGVGDLDGLTVKPIDAQEVVCDGVQVTFDIPGSVIYSPERYFVYLDGQRQTQVDSTGANRWEITSAGKITFTTVPEAGVTYNATLWQPLSTVSDQDADETTFTQNGSTTPTTVGNKLRESASLKDFGATGLITDDATQAFIEACTHNSEVKLVDGVYKILTGTVPDTAKVRKIVLQNAQLFLQDGSFDIDVAGQQIEIDCTAGGVIHGGLRKVSVTSDVAIGTNVIPCSDTSDIEIGQNIATSFQTYGMGGSKWSNSIREAGDAFNIVTGKTASSITLQYPVGAADSGTEKPLWMNTVLGNARFDKPGLRFNGYGKVTITGGEFKECRSGYYISTEGVDIGGGLILETHDVDFSGQFLDGFRIGGFSSFIANGGSMIGSYDLSKQLCVYQHRAPHKVQFNNVKVARGNNDLDFYTFGNSAGGKIGLVELVNCDMDGTWTLPVTAGQVNSISGQTLQEAYGIIQDALHCWTCEELAPTSPDTISRLDGFIARGTKFKNYRRAVAGTSFINASRSFELDYFLQDDCIYDETAPFYISVAATYTFKMLNKGISNAKIKRNGTDGTVYPLGLYNYEDGFHYSGTTVYDPNNGVVTDPVSSNNNGGSFNGLITFDHLTIRGSGQIRANLPEVEISRLTIDKSFFYDTAGFNEFIPTKITTLNGGSLNSANSFTTDRVATSSTLIEIPANDTNWHVIRHQVWKTSTFSPYFMVSFSGYRRFADEYGFEGIAAGTVGKTAVPITLGTTGYVNVTGSDTVHWISDSVISHGFNLADGSVELIITAGGDLAMRLTQGQPYQTTLTVDVRGGKRYD